MTIKTWLDNAIQEAERRGLTPLRPLLENLARATSALRTADWNYDASGEADVTADASAEADLSRRSGGAAEADAR
jgi:hypothetical protein